MTDPTLKFLVDILPHFDPDRVSDAAIDWEIEELKEAKREERDA